MNIAANLTAVVERALPALSGSNVTVSRLAAGLPIGGDLEYAERLTLARSIKGRISF